MYLLLLPGLVWVLVFCYGPMFGLVIAFQDYKPFLGVMESKFNHFGNFTYLFSSDQFWIAMKNTVIISFYKIVIGFPMPILFALMMNELRSRALKRSVQTILYLPHFLSWVIMYGVLYSFLGEGGTLNRLITAMGGDTVYFMSDTSVFRTVIVASDIWKELGWSAIIYLAALAGVPPEIYESATMDGANRLQVTFKISLPYILPTISVMLLLRIGGIMNAGFEQILSLYNASVFSVADIIDTYVYRIGLLQTKFGVSAAAGMFKSIIAFALVLFTNHLMKKADQESLF